MPTNNIKSKSGFTIIEVVLVLAVAGLIFLMVFIALPALQRSQRDTQRRQAVSQVHSALTSYQSNNSTKSDNLPPNGTCTFAEQTFEMSKANKSGTGGTEVCRFVQSYLNDGGANTTFIDPDGTAYSVAITTLDGTTNTTGSVDSFDHTMHIYRAAICDGETVKHGTGLRQFAILYALESGPVACVDNS